MSDIESLVSDPGFRNWVLNPDDISNRYWNTIAKDNKDKIELIKKARLIVLGLNQPEAEITEHDEIVLWDRIQASVIDNNKTTSRTHHFNHIGTKDIRNNSSSTWWYMIAASVGLVVAVWFGIGDHSVVSEEQNETISLIEKIVPNGQKLKMYLPDGSKVALNAGSKIVYPEKFAWEKRIVSIEGEAYFEIKKDSLRPFIVKSKDLMTEVLGTTFNVKSYPNTSYSTVALIEGKVKVKVIDPVESQQPNEFITILPGEQIDFNNQSNQLTKGIITDENELKWMDGVLVFNDEKIETVFNKLEQWYGVEFIYENMPRDKVLTGKFVNEYLDNILESINYTVQFTYRIDGDTVYVNFKR